MNEVLGKYHLIHKIGEGGFSEIYLAVHDEKPYSVKKLRRELADDKRVVYDFIREALIATRLDHSNIQKTIDHGKTDADYFSVMEPILGLSVKELVDTFKQLGKNVPLPLALYIIHETCIALKYLHQKTVFEYSSSALFHGDISPHNLILTQDGSLKLIDFGCSGQESGLDSTRKHFGKLSYLPGDIISGGNVDMATDIYSLGITAFYLFFGFLPFDSKNKHDLSEKIQIAKLPFFDTDKVVTTPSHANSLKLFFNQALSKERKFRFSSCSDFEKALFRIKFKAAVPEPLAIPELYPDAFMSKLDLMDRKWSDFLMQHKNKTSSEKDVSINSESLLACTNRRKHPRVSVKDILTQALLIDSAHDRKIESPIHEISRGGMLIRWEGLETKRGDEYPTILSLGKGYKPIQTNAQLLYKCTSKKDNFAGFEFYNLDIEDLKFLDRFVKSRLMAFSIPTIKDEKSDRIFLDVYFKDVSSLKEEFNRNISHGGMYLESDQELSEGDTVLIRIHLPHSFKSVLYSGKVVLVKPENTDKNGVAVQIVTNSVQTEIIANLISDQGN